jgi:hypothetical protein
MKPKPKFPLTEKYILHRDASEWGERYGVVCTMKELEQALSKAEQQGKLEVLEELRNQIDFDEVHRDIWGGCILYAYGTVGLIEERLKSQLSKQGAKE